MIFLKKKMKRMEKIMNKKSKYVSKSAITQMARDNLQRMDRLFGNLSMFCQKHHTKCDGISYHLPDNAPAYAIISWSDTNKRRIIVSL